MSKKILVDIDLLERALEAYSKTAEGASEHYEITMLRRAIDDARRAK